MRTTAVALIVSLLVLNVQALSAAPAPAATEQEASSWQKVAAAIPLGTKVKVRTIDGETIKGTLMGVEAAGVMVKKNTRRPEPAVTVPFDRVSNIERDNGGGFSVGKALAIGLGAGAGVILTIFVIALQLD